MTVSRIWLGYFLVKLTFTFLAVFVYSRFTSLGDTFRYLNGPDFLAADWFYDSTSMMDTFAGVTGALFGPVLGNVPFMVVSFIGIYLPVSRLDLTRNELVGLLAVLSFPSFAVWTSIASKEAVSVFFMGGILAAFIDYVQERRIHTPLLFAFCLYLCAVFKPQYLLAITAIFTFVWCSRFKRPSGAKKVLWFALAVFIGSAVLYAFRDTIDQLSKLMPIYFSKEAGSTRENTIWVEQYDFFWHMPYGMYIAFVGPTISEAMSKTTHLVAWLESMALLGVFVVSAGLYAAKALRTRALDLFFVGVFSLAAFWLLLVHYPFGALNPGSALRYRESFLSFLVILYWFLFRRAMWPDQTKVYEPGRMVLRPVEPDSEARSG